MPNSNPTVNNVPINTEKVQRILQKVIIWEKNNLQTKEKTDMQMVYKIKKLIEEEVECY